MSCHLLFEFDKHIRYIIYTYSYKQVYHEPKQCNLLCCACRTALHRYGSLSEKVMDFGNCLLATTHAIMIERKQQAKEIEEKEQDKTVVIDGLYT